MDEESVGSSPSAEECAQLGQEGYYEQAQKECTAYKNQLLRILNAHLNDNDRRSMPASSFRLRTKGFAHDFGTYYEVVAVYGSGDAVASRIANTLQMLLPEEWDDEARRELGL